VEASKRNRMNEEALKTTWISATAMKNSVKNIS